jgi:hypothetical protein
MTNAESQLFTVEEALTRLAQNREQGCLLACKGPELIHIYVKDGFVVRAFSGTKEGEAAVEQAVHFANAIYTWMRGVLPPKTGTNTFFNLNSFLAKRATVAKPKMVETRTLDGAEKKEVEAKFRYYLVPQDRLMEKLFLTKTSTVLGRDPSSDVVVDNADVSSRHCLLDIQTRGVSILDLDSTNGTFVNGKLVRDAFLNPGDLIELGPCIFIINREALHLP